MTEQTLVCLADLAAGINADHEAAERTARTALEYARSAGEKLLTAKGQVQHGQWLPWLADNCPRLATRTAQTYMKLAREWETLMAKCADSAHLSIDGALKLLTAPVEPDAVPDIQANPSPDVSQSPFCSAPSLQTGKTLGQTPQPANDSEEPSVSTPYLARNTGNNEWHTPAEYLEVVRKVLGTIDLDPASNPVAQETVKASQFFTLENDGLSRPWHGRVWLNPPYSQPAIAQFAEKLVAEWQAGNIEAALVLTNNASDTGWFHTLAQACTAFCLTRGRIGFEAPDGAVAATLRGQAFFYFGTNPVTFHRVFAQYGLTANIVQRVAA
jgi:phage N-6-adenine-methyltransferase